MYAVKINPQRPDKKIIARAAALIKKGGLVAFPTETVYGIAANFLDEAAVKRLYEIKGRPAGKPFTVHISDLKMIKAMGCEITARAKRLIDKFWPGPLTIILKCAGNGSMGFRMPSNAIALALIRSSNCPIAAPSANINGKIPPVSAEGIERILGEKLDMILDGGRTDVGIESTVLDLSAAHPKILREGAITAEKIKKYV